MIEDRVNLFGMQIDPLTMDGAVDRVLQWVKTPEQGCRYVVTPNVDHAVVIQSHAGLKAAYNHAGMVLADGMPLVLEFASVGPRAAWPGDR